MLARFKIGTRLVVGFGLAVTMTALVGGAALNGAETLANLTARLYRHPFAVTNALATANAHIIDMRSTMKDIVLARDAGEIDTAEKRVFELDRLIDAQFAIVGERFLGDRKMVEEVIANYRAWTPIRAEVVRLARAGERGKAEALALGDAARLVDRIRVGMNAVSDWAMDRAAKFMSAADATRVDILRTMGGLLAAALLVSVAAAWLIARGIVRPIGAMIGAMEQLAAGKLTVEVPGLTHADEVGEIARAVQVFKEGAVEKRRMDEAERERLAAEHRADTERRARETAIGEEIARLVDAVAQGDLANRVGLDGKEGFYKTMSEGINRLTDTVAAVVGDLGAVLSALAQGDLTSRVKRDYHGVFATLKADVNTTSQKLGEIVGQIGDATEAIASAAAEVSSGSTDLSERTEQQAAALEETAASMEELGGTVRASADNARRANTMANGARQVAEKGGGVADQAIGAMKRIAESSRKITDIIGVIDEIAFQTNLLALNAAVEAARAGEAGRGFAVVAQEVRQLAQRSAQASKEIKTLILDSDEQVRSGVDLVAKAGEALGGIVHNVRDVATLIAEMTGSSTEQASALDAINAAVGQMDEMTQRNAALVEETSAAAHAMSDQAEGLRELVGFFHL